MGFVSFGSDHLGHFQKVGYVGFAGLFPRTGAMLQRQKHPENTLFQPPFKRIRY